MIDQENKMFENDSFRIEAVFNKGCQIVATVFVKPSQLKKCYKEAIKKINKEISVPGFRKGKAPDATVISRYGSFVEGEWKDVIKKEAFKASIDHLKVYPLNQEGIKAPTLQSCSHEDGAFLQVVYEYYPLIPNINFSEITLPNIEINPISEERVHEILEEIRRTHADWEEIKERPVQEGDYADISIDAIDQDPVKSIVKDRRFEVHEKRMSSWLRQILLGMNAGETREGMSELDERADDQVKASFQPTLCRVTLHSIQKIHPPEIDDNLAKKVGATSQEDLLEKIRTNLSKEAQFLQKEKLIKELETALLEKYPFDIPFSLYEREKKAQYRDRLNKLKTQNLSEEQLKAQETELEAQVNHDVQESLRLYFLIRHIADQEHIEVSQEELNEEIVKYVSRNALLMEKEMDAETSKRLVSRLGSMLLEKKTKEYALKQIIGDHIN